MIWRAPVPGSEDGDDHCIDIDDLTCSGAVLSEPVWVRFNQLICSNIFLIAVAISQLEKTNRTTMLPVVSVECRWGVQDIFDLVPMRVQAEASDAHFCDDVHSVRIRFLDIPDRLLRQSSGA